jgi:transposase
MVSIRKIKNREGIEYVHLMESFRENGKPKCLSVKSYGRYDKLIENNPNAYEDLRQKAKNNEIDYVSRRSEISMKLDLSEEIGKTRPLSYGWLPLKGIYDTLGVSQVIEKYSQNHKYKYDLNKILQLLVFSRILKPKSKSRTVVNQGKLWGDWNVTQNAMDRGMDNLFEIIPQIQMSTHKAICNNIGRTGTLVFYDVTNFFFQIDENDEYDINEYGEVVKVKKGGGLRVKGFSKEHRAEQIVQLGLFMDSKGIPISFKLFPGNFNDPKTYVPAVQQVKKQFALEKIVTVADKAMNSITNISDAKKSGDGYIFSAKVRGKTGVPKDIQDFALEESGWKYNEARTFAIKSKVHPRKLANGEKIREKMVVVWSEKYATRQKYKRNGVLEHAQSLTNSERYRQSCKVGPKKFIEQYEIDEKTGEKIRLHPFLGIDWNVVEEDEKYDGINVILTSEVYMEDEEILKQYHNLSKIEDCFRVSKTDFRSRPVYVWTIPHIYAHFLSCFLALQIMRILQMKTHRDYSVAKLISALKSAVAKETVQGYFDVSANKRFCEMMRRLGKVWDKRNVHESKFSKLSS